MAVLKSEDPVTTSTFQLVASGAQEAHDQESWQPVAVSLTSGKHLASSETFSCAHDCLLCRAPMDEMAHLLYLLNEMRAFRSDKLSFEPAEPFFELSIERSGDHGLKVEVWLDAGNAETGIYTWDAIGVRFHTTEDNLACFISELEREFPC